MLSTSPYDHLGIPEWFATNPLHGRSKRRVIRLGVSAFILGASACGHADESLEPIEEPARTVNDCADLEASRAALVFPPAEGGGFEVGAHWLHANRCAVRLIDLREAGDLVGVTGQIPGAEAVPILSLPSEASGWPRTDPIVLVCELGRRSRGAAVLLESMGFLQAASLQGGMAAWTAAHYEVSHDALDVVQPVVPAPEPDSEIRIRPDWVASDDLSIQHVREHFAIDDLRWVKIANLMLSGHEHCVDGRDREHHILGTPGGDAGEFLLLLATVEQLHQEPLDLTRVPALLADQIDAFGHFYMHTDTHAVAHLLESLREDPRFAEHLPAEGDLQHTEILIRHPPEDLRPYLLEHLLDPHNVGCGHLRLVLEHPEEYGVRVELSHAVLRAVFEDLWSDLSGIDYEVLQGDHEEGAVVNVTVAGTIRTFTWVPAVRPAHSNTQIFINHPQVSAYLRRQATLFLIDREPWMHVMPNEEEQFVEALDRLAATQIQATVRHLAPSLPVFQVHFEDRRVFLNRLR